MAKLPGRSGKASELQIGNFTFGHYLLDLRVELPGSLDSFLGFKLTALPSDFGLVACEKQPLSQHNQNRKHVSNAHAIVSAMSALASKHLSKLIEGA